VTFRYVCFGSTSATVVKTCRTLRCGSSYVAALFFFFFFAMASKNWSQALTSHSLLILSMCLHLKIAFIKSEKILPFFKNVNLKKTNKAKQTRRCCLSAAVQPRSVRGIAPSPCTAARFSARLELWHWISPRGLCLVGAVSSVRARSPEHVAVSAARAGSLLAFAKEGAVKPQKTRQQVLCSVGGCISY